MSDFEKEVRQGNRFRFGKNWRSYITQIDELAISHMEKSLQEYLGLTSLEGMTFLDAGSGSGLSSLAARRLGANVHSFDYDPDSVQCTREIKGLYFKDDQNWTIEEGSVLDRDYLEALGQFDIVYSWGVLHHTGDMAQALENVSYNVKADGLLYISIYNTQVYWTPIHTLLKRTYNRGPYFIRILLLFSYIILGVVRGLAKDLLFLTNPFKRYQKGNKPRGMGIWHDWVDWVGGYPFETAKPEEIFDFYRNKGYILEKLFTAGSGSGCNQFVFRNDCIE